MTIVYPELSIGTQQAEPGPESFYGWGLELKKIQEHVLRKGLTTFFCEIEKMTIVALQPVVQFPNTNEERIGRSLYHNCLHHFIQFMGVRNIGLGYNGCTAAVAVDLDARYDQIAVNGMNFSVVYGASRLHAGLDPDFNAFHGFIAPRRPFSSSQRGEHAEQTAIRVAQAGGLNFWLYNGNCHIYVDLNPCPNCTQWLTARPENWYVHYYALIAHQRTFFAVRRKRRREEHGSIWEPPRKRRKLNT